LSPEESEAALQQLVDLGYIEAPDADRQKAVKQTVRELRYNLGCAYLDAYRYNDAGKLFEQLYQEYPDEYRFGLKYISCLTAMGRKDQALEEVDVVLERKRANMKKARVELKAFQQKVKDKEVDPSKFSRQESFELRRLRAEATISEATVATLRAGLLEAKGEQEAALEQLESIQTQGLVGLNIQLRIASIYTKLKRYTEAEAVLLKALAIDDEDASVRLALAENYLAWRHNFNAAAEALKATELSYFNPRAHYLLGTALHRLGKVKASLDALKLAVTQNPVYPEAHRRLAFLYEKRLGDAENAAKHKGLARQARARINQVKRQRGFVSPAEALGETRAKNPEATPEAFAWWSPAASAATRPREEVITVVSGLPRSGTSLMMQMLQAAGLTAVTDSVREADTNNPKGYFEYEPVKQLGQGSADWLDTARGQVIKIIAQLLPRLPKTHGYQVVFMLRDLDEIVRSQTSMLERLNRKGAGIAPERMRAIFEGQLMQVSEVLKERNIPLLLIRHADCLKDPHSVAAQLEPFLAQPVDPAAIAATVDGSLYRSGKG